MKFLNRSKQYSSTRTSFGVLSKLKVLRNFKPSEPEFTYFKALIEAPIDIDDLAEKEKFIEEKMNFKQKFENLSVF